MAVKDKVVYFLLGNHDHDLVYPEVQEKIKNILKNETNAIFPGLKYQKHNVYVEHGHQYDFIFRVNLKKLFLQYKGSSILNFPFVSFGLIGVMMRMKEDHPFLERINPRPELLTHHRVVMKKISRKTISYFLKSLIYYPFRFYSDPTYSRPTHLLREAYRRMRRGHYDIDEIITIFKKKKRKAGVKVYVLGHEHQKRISKGRKRVIIHPGTWRDEYDFHSRTRELISRTKRYVQILIKDGEPAYKLVDIPLQRSILDFDEVIKDEIKYIKQAAEEEKFDLYLI